MCAATEHNNKLNLRKENQQRKHFRPTRSNMADLQNENSYISILNSIRSSSYNYSIKETPYSIYLTLRKSIRNPPNNDLYCQVPLDQAAAELNPENEIEKVKRKLKSLEHSNQALTRDLEEYSNDNEVKQKTIKHLTSKLEILHTKLVSAETANGTALESNLEAIEIDKRHIEIKHLKTCSKITELMN